MKKASDIIKKKLKDKSVNASDDPLSDLSDSIESRKAKKTESSEVDETASDSLDKLLSAARRRVQKRSSESSDFDVARQQQPHRRSGLSPTALLALPRNQRDLINWLSRKREAALCDMQNALGQSIDQLTETIRALQEAGYIKETLRNGDTYYRVVFSGRTKRAGQGLSKEVTTFIESEETT